MFDKIPPCKTCDAKGCNKNATLWFGTSGFAYCGSLQCAEKLVEQIEKFVEEEKLNIEAKYQLFDSIEEDDNT